MAISFDRVPIDVRTPGQYIEFDPSQAVGGLATVRNRILVVGQRLDAGEVAAATPKLVTSVEQAERFFGRGSMLANMIVALRKVNSWTETWAIALDDDDAAAAATGSITFGGTVTQPGTINLYIAGTRVRVGVGTGDALGDLATAAADAINEQTDLPVTAQANGTTPEQVDITARNAGEAGNDIDIRTNYYQGEEIPGDVTVTISDMTTGSANPDISPAIDAVSDSHYTTWILPYTDQANLDALATEMDRRWGPMVQLEGHAYLGAAGTLSSLQTLGDNQNSPNISIIGADSSPTPPWYWAAAFGGTCAYYGHIDPARPFQTLPLTGVMAPFEQDRFDQAEREILLNDGITTFNVADDGTVRIERAITTYQTTDAGVPSIAYLDVNTVLTLAFLRYTTRVRIAQKYPRHKLADNGTNFGAGQAIVTPNVIRAELITLFRQWEQAGLAENAEQFKEDLIVERDSNDPNRLNALIPPDVVNQFRVFAGKVQFRL